MHMPLNLQVKGLSNSLCWLIYNPATPEVVSCICIAPDTFKLLKLKLFGFSATERARPKSSRQSSLRRIHVMISYQWNSQRTVLKIRDALVVSGYCSISIIIKSLFGESQVLWSHSIKSCPQTFKISHLFYVKCLLLYVLWWNVTAWWKTCC